MAAEAGDVEIEAWQARVDDRGYLATPLNPKPFRGECSFVGTPRIAADGWEEWDAVQFGTGETAVVLRIGEPVFLSPRCKGRPMEIAFLMSCFNDKTGYKWVSVQWLWRPEHMEKQVDDYIGEHELLLGDLTQENPYESLEL